MDDDSVEYGDAFERESQRNDDRDQLHALRELHVSMIEPLFDQVENDVLFNEFTSDELRVIKTEMQSHLEEVRRAHILYRQVCVLASDDLYNGIRARFIRVMGKIDARIRALGVGLQGEFSRATVNANSTAEVALQPVVRVESNHKPQIGTFDGSPADWPAFKDLFLAEVDRRDIEPVQKLIYLKRACVGKAAKALGHHQLTGDNYKIAWGILTSAYDNKYHIVHDILNRIYKMERHSAACYSASRDVYDALNSGTRELLAICTPEEVSDQRWIHLGNRYLPKEILDAWQRTRTQLFRNRLPTLADYMEFLDTDSLGRIESLAKESPAEPAPIQSEHVIKRSKNESQGQRRTKSAEPMRKLEQNRRHGFGAPGRCVMPNCEQTHYLGLCDQFRHLSGHERSQVVYRNRLCRCCLLPGHMAHVCERPGCSQCPDAQIKHHFRLCSRMADSKQGKFETRVQGAANQ